jgi:large subunit ribosomal protein L6e
VAKVWKGRKSITPGTVVILLSGVHRGRRVVALKNLEHGFILATGPYAINGVPLKRVNAAYVIATSTRVSLDGVTANIDPKSFFTKQKKYTKHQLKNASEARTKRLEAGKTASTQWHEQAKKTQETIDKKLIENIRKVPELKGYLSTRFTLSAGVKPHELKF